MDDLDMLARDFGFGPRGKSNPMRSDPADRSRPAARSSIDDPLFSEIFTGPRKYSSSSNTNANSNKYSSMNDFDYDSIFKSSESSKNNNSSKTSSLPVYDKPVYDEDIFDGLPGLKSKPASSTVKFDDGMFAPILSPPASKSNYHHTDFDDLLGKLGTNEKEGESNKNTNPATSSNLREFDDLLAGFGGGSSATSNRPIPESSWGSIPAAGSKSRVVDNPFVVLESTSNTGSSASRVFTDPLEEITMLGKSRSASAAASSGSGMFDDLDPLNNFGNPVHASSSDRDSGEKDGSPSRSASPQSGTTREQKGNSSFGYSENNMEKKIPLDNFQEPPLFDVPNVSADFQKSFGQTAASPLYDEKGAQVDIPYTSEEQGQQLDDIWLTVSEIPLFTQPTNAPPPSRPPPPILHQTSRSESGSSSSVRKEDDLFSPSSYPQHSQSPKRAQPAAKSSPVSQFDELEDFAKGLSRNDIDEGANHYSSEENNAASAAAASAAAMKEAMDKAEAKFRHAKEVREREYAKTARNKESLQLEKDEQDVVQEREFRETQERLEHERKQKEEEEREQRRLERERLRDIERERARQAVERATKEARERAAAEARLKAERAAVEKVNAEARSRAERAAVQRVQAEARERAAAEAKERAERAATEARERAAAAEAREKEAADKASMARTEAEARRRAERAAVERAAAEARERAAAEARERAAAAAKANQQKNDNDLDSFFGVSRASSAPKARAHSTASDPMFDQEFQTKGGSEAVKRTSSSGGVSSNMKKASSTTNIVDDLSSIFGAAPSSGEFHEVEGETIERRRARMDRNQRTQERAAKALAEKNQRDIQAQREQEERHRISDTLDSEIKRWAAGKEGNLRALLSTLQYVLWPECGWQPVSLTDLIMGASVKKVYRKATLCIHPDKVQQKGATLQQKYIAEKVFDLLKEAWNKFNSEELF